VLAHAGVIAAGDTSEDCRCLDPRRGRHGVGQLSRCAPSRRALERELLTRLDELGRLRQTIEGVAATVSQQLQRSSRSGCAACSATGGLDSGAPRTGGRPPADRADLTEELVRLGSHLDQARAIVGGVGPSGRKPISSFSEIGRELTRSARSRIRRDLDGGGRAQRGFRKPAVPRSTTAVEISVVCDFEPIVLSSRPIL